MMMQHDKENANPQKRRAALKPLAVKEDPLMAGVR
jgi:hypothetical protein